MICEFFSVFCKIVYQWVMTNCCFMSNIIPQEKQRKEMNSFRQELLE